MSVLRPAGVPAGYPRAAQPPRVPWALWVCDGGRQAAGTAHAVGGRQAARGRSREGPAGAPQGPLAGRRGERSERAAAGGPVHDARARPSAKHREAGGVRQDTSR